MNPATCNSENGRYLASIVDNPGITCDEVIKSYNEEIQTIPTHFIELVKKIFYILLAFLLIAITLLIAVSVFCCLIKYQTKPLLPFHDIKN